MKRLFLFCDGTPNTRNRLEFILMITTNRTLSQFRNISFKVIWIFGVSVSTTTAFSQVIQCVPVYWEEKYLDDLRGVMKNTIQCNKSNCGEFKLDVEKCEKTATVYICNKDLSDNQYEEIWRYEIDRDKLTATRVRELTNRKSKFLMTTTTYYKDCKKIDVAPKI